jgi:hypothetical protein
MNESMKELFLSFSEQQKIVFLADLSHDLTIHGRVVWLDLEGDDQTCALKGLNELQHQISQNISHLANGTNTYSGELVWRILHGTAAQYGLSAHLRSSLNRLASCRALRDRQQEQS